MARRWTSLVVAGLAALGFVGAAPGGAADAATAAGLTDPGQNVVPSPAYWNTCVQSGTDSQTCTDAIVQAIDNARSLEGVGPMVLPTGFASLSAAQQTFVVSNLERVDRGLPPVAGMVDSLDSVAADAANADTDPMLSGWTVGPFQASGWSSIWAGDLNPLAADYDWMYDDGWGPTGSYNLDCTSATASGCWGHRHAILSAGDQLITGVAAVTQSQWMSVAQILVTGSGAYPAFTYSWADVVGATTPTSTPDPATVVATVPTTATVRPVVVVHAWPTSATRRTIVATLTPVLAQPVQLRRHSASGWHTVRRATAASVMRFSNLRRGAYRLVVSAVPGSTRVVMAFALR